MIICIGGNASFPRRAHAFPSKPIRFHSFVGSIRFCFVLLILIQRIIMESTEQQKVRAYLEKKGIISSVLDDIYGIRNRCV